MNLLFRRNMLQCILVRLMKILCFPLPEHSNDFYGNIIWLFHHLRPEVKYRKSSYEVSLGVSFSPQTTLSKLEDTLVYIPQYSSIVYNILNDRIDVRYSFDFEDKWITDDFEKIKWNNAVDL